MAFQFNRAKRAKQALLDYNAAKAQESDAKARKEAARAIVLEAMGTETEGRIGRATVLTIGKRAVTSVAIADLRRAHPEIVAELGKERIDTILNVTL